MSQSWLRALGAGVLSTLIGCSGQLVIDAPESQSGAGCVSSAECGAGRVCQGFECVDSDGRCSVSNRDGDCPLGRLCQGGICVAATDGSSGNGNGNENGNGGGSTPGGFDCFSCDPEQLCDGLQCVDPTDSAKVCGEVVLDGACPLGEVCVAGACTPITAGKNDCAPERPTGLCPPASTCVEGFCLPLDERPCSGVTPDGACPAGQSCTAGSCSVVACSSSAPFGACSSGLVCLDGTCRPETALLTCEELDCAGRNREACTVDAEGIARCGACVDGYFDDGVGTCVPDSCTSLDCAGQFRTCELGPPDTCGECVAGYFDGDFGCEPVTCAELACGDENRECVSGATAADPAECGACASGFVEDAGACRLATCADLGAQCAAQNRACEENASTGAVCGDCVSGATVAANGECAVCDTGNCNACGVTQDCIDRGAGGYCNITTELCTIECTTAGDCASNETCTPNGRCAATSPGGGVCGAGVADEGELVRPLVHLLVDFSGSMTSNFDGQDRFRAVQEILFGTNSGSATSCQPSGLVAGLDDEIRFGLATYKTSGSPPNRDLIMDFGNGPDGTALPPLANCDTLVADYAGQSPQSGTPTAEAFEVLLADLVTLRNGLETAGEPVPPTFVIVATDGQPESTWCTNSPNTVGEWWVLDVARRAYEDYGIQTFALSVGGESDSEHLQDLANVGAGLPIVTPLDYEGYTSCDSFSGDDDIRVNRPLNEYPGFTALPDCEDSAGVDPGDCSGRRGTYCGSDRMESCVANERDTLGLPTYQSAYGVASCSSTDPVDVDSDGTAEMAACYVGADGALLRDALDDVFQSVRSCLIQLQSTDVILGGGTVYFDDDVIQEGVDWRFSGLNRIEIIGDRCDELQDGDPHFVTVEVTSCGGGG